MKPIFFMGICLTMKRHKFTRNIEKWRCRPKSDTWLCKTGLGWVGSLSLGRWDKGRLKNFWYVMASLVYIDITFISIVDILQWLKKAQAGRPARILQKVGWKTRSWDLVSTLASPGNFDQMSQQCLNFFHSGMKNINCSLIDPHQKHLTRLFLLI